MGLRAGESERLSVLLALGSIWLFAAVCGAQSSLPLPTGPDVDAVETIPGLTVPHSDRPPTPSPPAHEQELPLESLVSAVLSRNPTLAEMTAAWQAAQARYPQVTSLEDPMLMTKLGPGSIGSDTVNFAYMAELSQKLPYPGKLRLRGDTALAEASAAGHELEDTRLELIHSARQGFYDYYLVDRALAVNAEALALLRDFRKDANTRYVQALAPQQDILQADVEIGRQQERDLALKRMRTVAQARLNTLLHQSPDSPLPPPPSHVEIGEQLPPAAVLRAQALSHRPDLQAEADHIRAEEASLGLAHKEFCPDFEVAAGYDAFWQKPLRPEISVRLNLPVYRARRYGAVAEAEARIAQRRAALARLADQISFQVQEAYAQVKESEQTIRLYEETILPKAEQNVKSARAAYATSRIPFLSLIEAERSLVDLRDRYYEAIANYCRRRATLERVVGGPFSPGAIGRSQAE